MGGWSREVGVWGRGGLGSEGVMGSGVLGLGGEVGGLGGGLEGCFYGELCYYLRVINFRKKIFFCFFHATLPDKSKQVCF